jgi:hypothetical protein
MRAPAANVPVMPTEVLATPRAEQQIGALRRKHSMAFENFLNDLATSGCRALGYRLSGETPLNHLCVKHLDRSLRVVVAFERPQRAWVLLVGQHDDQDPVLNIYSELYRLIGIEPSPDIRRTKPPCCDEADKLPPVLEGSLNYILNRAAKIRRTRQSRQEN